MTAVIQIEDLSKKYIIRHEGKARYATLRDAAVESVRQFGKSIISGGRKRNSAWEEFWALRDISFEVEQGERIGIIGPNGAGKSTLLKILSRITEPTLGRARIKGRVSSLLEVGTGFHAELTGRENIYLNGAILGMTRAEINDKFDEIVSFAEVENFLDTPVKRYSSGMSVRLAFAVAAHLEPEILLVDEVLAVGDAKFQQKCLGKMGEVSKRGRTVFFVSHNMAAIQMLCSRVIRLDKGKVVGQGDAAEQVEQYLRFAQHQPDRVDGQVMLGPVLELHRLEFTPNPVESCSDVDFEINLKSLQPITLDELVLLFYTSSGMRVAHIDLREKGMPYKFDGSDSMLIIKGKIFNLPFVEGSYQIGFYLNYEKAGGDFLNLSELKVTGNTDRFDCMPYPTASRGVVELDCKLLR